MLFNECETISRGDDQIYLAGVDDAHFLPADDFEKKLRSGSLEMAFSILLVAYARSLRPRSERWIRPHAQRTHPWRTALPPWWNSDQLEARLPVERWALARGTTPAWSVTLSVGAERAFIACSSKLPARNNFCIHFGVDQ